MYDDSTGILYDWSNGGGGGGSAVLINKTITANGTFNASSDDADGYKKVIVQVPNSYTAQDEGKVVDNGALVEQTAMPNTITENGNYNTTNYNSVTVNVGTSYNNTSRRATDYPFGSFVSEYTPDSNTAWVTIAKLSTG